MKEEICDVLVIGTGFAGLSAAYVAANRGLEVFVLEKMGTPGGNSRISDGGIAAPNTDLQKKNGIEDSPALMAEDMLKAGKGRNDSALVNIVAQNAKDVFTWTRETLGVEYEDRVDLFGGHSAPRSYAPKGTLSGRPLLQGLLKRLKRNNVRFFYKTYVQAFVQDERKRVVGVEALYPYHFTKEVETSKIFFRARKGVALCSGGFGADKTLKTSLDAKLQNISTTNKPSSTGELLKAAQKIGAKLQDMDCIQLAPWASPDEKGMGAGPLFGDYIVLPYGIVVDRKTGKRFTDELADRDTVAQAILDRKEPAIGIADDQAVKRDGLSLEKALKKQVVRAFDSVETLAKHYNVDYGSLAKTIEITNQGIKNGKDAFKKSLSKRATPIEVAPFYAMRMWPKVHHTMGGLAIDTKARVLDKQNTPIEGLFAAGEAAAGVHGAGRLGSCAITDCLVMGRVAGKNASL